MNRPWDLIIYRSFPLNSFLFLISNKNRDTGGATMKELLKFNIPMIRIHAYTEPGSSELKLTVMK